MLAPQAVEMLTQCGFRVVGSGYWHLELETEYGYIASISILDGKLWVTKQRPEKPLRPAGPFIPSVRKQKP